MNRNLKRCNFNQVLELMSTGIKTKPNQSLNDEKIELNQS